MTKEQALELLGKIKENIGEVIIGKEDVIEFVLAALLSRGHVLIEDVPGLGKTTLVAALADSISCSFGRIQFTPDVTPSDITGFMMYHIHSGEKEFQQGVLMNQILLADEINRTSPKTQSALLQAMQENQVTVDGESYRLPEPFMVLATQNPIEFSGTYPLPEAQLDRFFMCISMGYPSGEQEVQILKQHRSNLQKKEIEAVCSGDEIIRLQEIVSQVSCADAVLNYITELAKATRKSREITLGISPRGTIALMHAAMASAFLQGRDYVIPDDVQKVIGPVWAHRLQMKAQAASEGQTAAEVIRDIVKKTRVPSVHI